MRCNQCGEPWELDSLHEYTAEEHYEELQAARAGSHAANTRHYARLFSAAHRAFTAEGCHLFGASHNEPFPEDDPLIIREIQDLLGDDVDGAQNLLEDAGFDS